MRATQYFFVGLSSLIGFIGGYLITTTNPARAGAPEIIRARRFELTDESGKTLAFLGRNSKQEIVLAFSGEGDQDLAALGMNSGRRRYPFLRLLGHDGVARAVLQLGEEDKPILGLGDGSIEGRILLGVIRSDYPSPNEDNWGLRFRAPNLVEPTTLGMFHDKRQGTVHGSISVLTEKGETWSVH